MPLSTFRAIKEDGYGVFHFRDKWFSDPFAPAHYYIAVPFDSANELMIAMITSQWERLEKRYSPENALGGLVRIAPNELSFLNRPISVANCNDFIRSTPEGMAQRVDETHSGVCHFSREILSDGLKLRIFNGFMASPGIKDRTKAKIIRP